MNLESKFGYFIITQILCCACEQDGMTYKQINGKTFRLLDDPSGPFRPGA